MDNLWKNVAVGLFLIVLIFGYSQLKTESPTIQEKAPVKEQVAVQQVQKLEPEMVPKKQQLTELEFDITGQYLGRGEVQASVQTNLPQGTKVDFNVLSISVLSEGYDEDGGIDYSRWYNLRPSKAKNVSMGQDIFLEYDSTLTVSKDGTVDTTVLLFHPEALKHDFNEIKTIIHKTSYDDSLADSLENRQVLERDGKFVIDFRITQNKYNERTNQAEDNLNGTQIGNITLPLNCTFVSYELFGQRNDIKCTKEIFVSNKKGQTAREDSHTELKKRQNAKQDIKSQFDSLNEIHSEWLTLYRQYGIPNKYGFDMDINISMEFGSIASKMGKIYDPLQKKYFGMRGGDNYEFKLYDALWNYGLLLVSTTPWSYEESKQDIQDKKRVVEALLK